VIELKFGTSLQATTLLPDHTVRQYTSFVMHSA